MKRYHFAYDSELPFSADEVFAWHRREGALDRMIPPWVQAKVLQRGDPSQVGSLTIMQMGRGPISLRWIAEHVGFTPGREFIDEQKKGPFKFWRHIHRVEAREDGCVYKDIIEYTPSFFLSKSFVEKELQRQFAFRHKQLLSDLSLYKAYDQTPKRILLSGSNGMVGSALASFLKAAGHDVWKLQRGNTDLPAKIIGWDPSLDGADRDSLEGFEVVLHLAGENIGIKKWNERQKSKIFQSRCRDTWLLSHMFSRLKNPPKIFLSASAIGIYGDRKKEILTEESSLGHDFLSDVCIRWEEASEVLRLMNVRTCALRFGYILSPKAGMLRQMLAAFKAGLGGKMGSGEQVVSWVALDDVIRAIYHCIMNESLQGPVNVVAPHPVTQEEFAKNLAKVLHRPCVANLPAWLLRALWGERADALILRSAHVLAEKLEKSGFAFRYTDLEGYFRESLSL